MLDLLYGQVAKTRREWYERHPEARRRLANPVISVGNVSVGGSGKTPLVAQLAAWLLERGERPAILSRGYKRRMARDGVTVVSDGASVLADILTAGDEPLMLARKIPGAIVCVADDRHLAGAVAERVLGATVHILDDGFQHLPLARDLDIILTATGEITQGRVLPRGRLREGREAAARAAFAVVVSSDTAAARTEAWELGISQFSAAQRVIRLTETSPAVAVAGIAHCQQFFDALRDAGGDIRDTVAFADHHQYAPSDVSRIDVVAKAAQVRVVMTTEKDAVRLETLAPLPFELVAVPMHLAIEDWTALTAAVSAAVCRRRGVS